MPPTLMANAPDHQVAGDVLSAAVDAHCVSRTLDSCEGKKSENINSMVLIIGHKFQNQKEAGGQMQHQ